MPCKQHFFGLLTIMDENEIVHELVTNEEKYILQERGTVQYLRNDAEFVPDHTFNLHQFPVEYIQHNELPPEPVQTS